MYKLDQYGKNQYVLFKPIKTNSTTKTSSTSILPRKVRHRKKLPLLKHQKGQHINRVRMRTELKENICRIVLFVTFFTILKQRKTYNF